MDMFFKGLPSMLGKSVDVYCMHILRSKINMYVLHIMRSMVVLPRFAASVDVCVFAGWVRTCQ